MLNLKELKEIALANVTSPDYEYYYRFVCRWFSKTFHTPIQDVYSMSADQVFLAYFEEGYEKISESEDGEDALFIDMMKAIDPDYDEKEEESIQEFIEMLETEEEEKKKAKDFKMKSTPSIEPAKAPVTRTYDDNFNANDPGEDL